MRGTVVREPGLELPDLPHGVTEVTIRRNGNVLGFIYMTPYRSSESCVRHLTPARDLSTIGSSSTPLGSPK